MVPPVEGSSATENEPVLGAPEPVVQDGIPRDADAEREGIPGGEATTEGEGAPSKPKERMDILFEFVLPRADPICKGTRFPEASESLGHIDGLASMLYGIENEQV